MKNSSGALISALIFIYMCVTSDSQRDLYALFAVICIAALYICGAIEKGQK